MQEEFAALEETLRLQLEALFSDYAAGVLTPAEFVERADEAINAAIYAAWLIGANGQEPDEEAEERLRSYAYGQLEYLKNFGRQMEAETWAAGWPARIASYTGALTLPFWWAWAWRYSLVLPAYPGDGTSECLQWCKCEWEVHHLGGDDYDAFWRLGYAEHCPTCAQRAVLWNPLQIRDGKYKEFTPKEKLTGVVKVAYKHILGRHNQKLHGRRGGQFSNISQVVRPAKNLDEAKAQNFSQADIISHIMRTNPPEQVASGKMTSAQWADKFMSDEPGGYALIRVHPKALYFPAETNAGKVGDYTAMPRKTAAAIVLDSNNKLEARMGGGKLDRAYGRQPYTVIDGKHRAEAAMQRGDKSILSYVPKSRLGEVWQNSKRAELVDFALGYFSSKGYPVKRQSGDDFIVERNGVETVYTPVSLARIAKNTGYEFSWKELEGYKHILGRHNQKLHAPRKTAQREPSPFPPGVKLTHTIGNESKRSGKLQALVSEKLGLDAAALVRDGLDGFQHGTLSSKVTGLELVERDGRSSLIVTGQVYDRGVFPAGNFQRIFSRRKDGTVFAYHNLFELEGKHQMGGFGTAFFRHSEAAYMKQPAIREIVLEANLHVGAYAWARMGFRFSSSREKTAWNETFRKAWNGQWPHTRELDAFELASLKSPWDEPTMPLAKRLLLGPDKSWDGVKYLDIQDAGFKAGLDYYRNRGYGL